MAAEIQTGTGVVYGVTNSGSAITIGGYATFLFDTVKGQHKWKMSEVGDNLGFDATLLAVNENFEIDIDFTPSGATRAAAAAVAVFLTPLSSVALANFKVALFNGTYVYIGEDSIELKNNGVCKLSGLKLRRYADSTQNTSLTTTVSG